MGLIPGLGRSLTLEPILHNKRSHCKEKPSQHSEDPPPHTQQVEKAPGQQWRPSAAKNKQKGWNKESYLKQTNKHLEIVAKVAHHVIIISATELPLTTVWKVNCTLYYHSKKFYSVIVLHSNDKKELLAHKTI